MVKILKRIFTAGIFTGALLMNISNLQAVPKNLQVELNHNIIQGVTPIIENGSTLVPLRTISNLIGASVEWKSSTKTITISQGSVTNTLKVGEKTAYK